MKTIHKYGLYLTDFQNVMFPGLVKILSAQAELGGSSLSLWAIVDPSQNIEARKIAIVGTGNPFPEEAITYIDTVQMSSGYVWHVFDCGPA